MREKDFREKFDGLTERQQQTLCLFCQGKKYEEIASRTDTKVGTVRSNMSKIYKSFKRPGDHYTFRQDDMREFCRFMPEDLKELANRFFPNKALRTYRFDLFPALEEDIPEIHRLCEEYFGDDLLPAELRRDWLKRDRNSFRVMKNLNGRIVSFFTVLFVKDYYFSQFIRGNLIERDLLDHSIISQTTAQGPGEDSIYISVVVGKENSKLGLCTLLYLVKYIDLLRRFRRIDKIYALAATDAGRRNIELLNFELYSSASKRKDKEDLYIFDCEKISNLYQHLEDVYPLFKEGLHNIELKSEDRWKPVW